MDFVLVITDNEEKLRYCEMLLLMMLRGYAKSFIECEEIMS